MIKIYIAADHAGFAVKEQVKIFLKKEGYEIIDCGADIFDKYDDYPDFISKAAAAVSKDPENSIGILCAGTGQAEAMLANKYKNVRCALFYAPAVTHEAVDITGRKSTDPFEIITLAREHNNANMLSLSGRFMDITTIEKAIRRFLATPFPGEERHVQRLEKIRKIEEHK